MSNPLYMACLKAGYDAFRAAYSTGYFGADYKPQLVICPYNQRPFDRLWRRGWSEAAREFDSGPPLSNFRYNPFEKNQRVLEFVRQFESRDNRKKGFPKQGQQQQHHRTKPYQGKTGKKNPLKDWVPTQSHPVKPGTVTKDGGVVWKNTGSVKPRQEVNTLAPISLKQVNRFNQKYRTQL